MNSYKEKIKEYLTELDRLGKHNYKELEIAIILYLRSDLEDFDYLCDKQFNALYDCCDNVSSLLDLNKEEIDYIIESGEDLDYEN